MPSFQLPEPILANQLPVDKPKTVDGITITTVESETTPKGLSQEHVLTTTNKALQILQVIESYGLHSDRNGAWEGVAKCLSTVTGQVERKEPTRLLLPGFAFKSPSKSKVLGVLPDLGEKLALAHLNSLCQNISSVYEHGAEIHISSDGLVYNDLLGASDDTAYEYGEAVRQIAQDQELHHLKFLRLWDLLNHEGPHTKDSYLAHASCLRRELVTQYGDAVLDLEGNKVFKAFVKYVREDLSATEDEAKNIAKSMIGRWKAYGSALEANCKDFVRLSIHDSDGTDKLVISLLPQEKGKPGLDPWHSAIAIELDGTFRTVRASDVKETHELVYVDGRPSHFRVKSDLFDWKVDGLDVTFDHVYPTGLIIRPSKPTSIRDIPMKKVRVLSQKWSPVVLRGFSETNNEELWVKKGGELGEVLDWKEVFGQILRVKDSGEIDPEANSVFSHEAMPMHYDGVFKFVDETNPVTGEVKRVVKPPGYQYFTCISTAPKGTGATLFSSSRLFFRHLPSPWTLERLQNVKWNMTNDGYFRAEQTALPLVIPHKETGEPCLRWHQPWTETQFAKYWVSLENEDPSLIEVIDRLTYDYRVCVRFEWEAGDLLVSDNRSMLHTRTAFTENSPREMWRIHFD